MNKQTEPDEEVDGVADLIEEAAADAREGARWVRANLGEMMDAIGVRDVDGSDPADP